MNGVIQESYFGGKFTGVSSGADYNSKQIFSLEKVILIIFLLNKFLYWITPFLLMYV